HTRFSRDWSSDVCSSDSQAQGYKRFISELIPYFPDEETALHKYIASIKYYCSQFPLYNLELGFGYNEELMRVSVQEVLNDITLNKKLQAVLIGNGFLSALDANRTPFYVHALTVNSYIQ